MKFPTQLSEVSVATDIAAFAIKRIMAHRHCFAGGPIYDALLKAESALLALQEAIKENA